MDPSIIGPLIGLVTVLIVIGAVAYGVMRAKKAASEISQVAFGTDNLMEGFKKQQAEYESTPKSLAAQTSLAMSRIKRDFPEFNLDDMRARAANVITSYLQSIDQQNLSLLTEGSPLLKDALELRVEALRADEKKEQFDRIKIHRMEISKYVKTKGQCIVTFQCALQSKHCLTDAAGQTITGSAERWEQSRYETDLIYVQDTQKLDNPELMALGLSCPNCSAPITNLGAKHCEYCGAAVREINLNSWTFNAVREV